MFDLTKDVKLVSSKEKIYRRLQAALYLTAVLTAFYLTYLVFFPKKEFNFSFLNPNSNDNNMDIPQGQDGKMPEKGKLGRNEAVTFDTTLAGDYSQVKVKLTLDRNSDVPQSPVIMAQKSYRAFLRKEGEPVGFRDASLIKSGGDFYIVSLGQIRKFSSPAVLEGMGYDPASFREVSREELRYNPPGSDIDQGGAYPDSTLFKIADNYYILKNQELIKFVSDQAFSVQYEENQAIKKNMDFLGVLPVSKDFEGYADGTLVSNGDSAYIISSGNIWPINSAETFLSKGYQWDKVFPIGEDEVALYEKTKLFKVTDPHPEGTVFVTVGENPKYYLLKDGAKHELPSQAIALSWLGQNAPISVNQDDISNGIRCDLKKDAFRAASYSCIIPTDNLERFIGWDYEFDFSAGSPVKINDINVTFEKNPTLENFKLSLLNFYNQIKGRYVPSPTT